MVFGGQVVGQEVFGQDAAVEELALMAGDDEWVVWVFIEICFFCVMGSDVEKLFAGGVSEIREGDCEYL